MADTRLQRENRVPVLRSVRRVHETRQGTVRSAVAELVDYVQDARNLPPRPASRLMASATVAASGSARASARAQTR